MQLGERKKAILRTIIDQYVDTAEPVGSKSVSSALSLSPATIRNEMAELEAHGLLEQPHTSAGRVPTASGYRFYVDELMLRHKLSIEETEELNRALKQRLEELDHIISYAGRIVSQMTRFPAFALMSKPHDMIKRFDFIELDSLSFIIVALTTGDAVRNKLIHLPKALPEGMLVRAAALFNANFTNITDEQITAALINSTSRAMCDEVGLTSTLAQFVIETLNESAGTDFTVSGSARLFEHREFHDVERARRVLDYLSREDAAPELPAPDAGLSSRITIGPENLANELRDSSVVVTRRPIGEGNDLLIGIVGPTRMDYPRVLSQLQYLSRGLAPAADTGTEEPEDNTNHPRDG